MVGTLQTKKNPVPGFLPDLTHRFRIEKKKLFRNSSLINIYVY